MANKKTNEINPVEVYRAYLRSYVLAAAHGDYALKKQLQVPDEDLVTLTVVALATYGAIKPEPPKTQAEVVEAVSRMLGEQSPPNPG